MIQCSLKFCPGSVSFFLKDKETTSRKLELKGGLPAIMGISWVGWFSPLSWDQSHWGNGTLARNGGSRHRDVKCCFKEKIPDRIRLGWRTLSNQRWEYSRLNHGITTRGRWHWRRWVERGNLMGRNVGGENPKKNLPHRTFFSGPAWVPNHYVLKKNKAWR